MALPFKTYNFPLGFKLHLERRNYKTENHWGFAVVIQLLSHVWLFVTPWTARQASLSFTISWSLLRLVFIESVMPSNHLILCHPLLLHSIFPESGSFPMRRLFASGGQNIGASALASVHPMNIQDWGLVISYYWKNMKHTSLTLGILYSIFINLVLFLLFK